MLIALIKTMRPRQWTKNAFVFAAIVFDHQLSLHNFAPLLRTIVGFVVFCLLSSAIYIINDIKDIESDRIHPRKRNRPIASGKLPIPVAIVAAVVLLLITFVAGYFLSFWFLVVCAAYFLENVLYSIWLKHVPLIDVLMIALGFVLRVSAGATIIRVERFSPWLYVATTLLALYIGFGKRRAELTLLAEGAQSHRRVLEGYNLPLLDQLITVVSSSTIVVYAFYTFSAIGLPPNHTMMLTIPFVIYGIFRYLYLIQIKHEGGAPEELLLADRPLQGTIAAWALFIFIILYILPLNF
ncbi:MAG TPA: decaprenyl-phosphate phosphoribosyltransferase [Anaerolineaceae bacterium]